MALISCPDCNKEVSENAASCVSCGFPVSNYIVSTKSQEISCGECEAKYTFDEKFCPKCGSINGKKLSLYSRNKTPLSNDDKPATLHKKDLGTAAVLSLFIPGSGQIYKGKLGIGLAWLFFTVLGYTLFVIPGIALHFMCIYSARYDED